MFRLFGGIAFAFLCMGVLCATGSFAEHMMTKNTHAASPGYEAGAPITVPTPAVKANPGYQIDLRADVAAADAKAKASGRCCAGCTCNPCLCNHSVLQSSTNTQSVTLAQSRQMGRMVRQCVRDGNGQMVCTQTFVPENSATMTNGYPVIGPPVQPPANQANTVQAVQYESSGRRGVFGGDGIFRGRFRGGCRGCG